MESGRRQRKTIEDNGRLWKATENQRKAMENTGRFLEHLDL